LSDGAGEDDEPRDDGGGAGACEEHEPAVEGADVQAQQDTRHMIDAFFEDSMYDEPSDFRRISDVAKSNSVTLVSISHGG